MKRYVLLAVCLWPALAYGQQTYTNADLVKLDVPGAYTNEDLKRFSPLALQGTPAARTPLIELRPVSGETYQAIYDGLRRARAGLVAERDDEIGRVDFSESASAGDSRAFEPRLGYRTKAAPFIRELGRRIVLLDRQIDEVVDEARRAGASIDQR